MIKIIAMLKRKSGMTLEEFLRYWYEKHASLGRSAMPQKVRSGIKSYIQNHAIRLGGEPHFDAVAETCFHDMDSLRIWNDWYFGDGGKVLRDDEDNFMDKSKRIIVVVEEKVVQI